MKVRVTVSFIIFIVLCFLLLWLTQRVHAGEDIPDMLAQNDAVHFVLLANNRSITFTRGHEILWCAGIPKNEIYSLGFDVILLNSNRIKELF